MVAHFLRRGRSSNIDGACERKPERSDWVGFGEVGMGEAAGDA
jgi:hypothetical protein